MGRPVKNEALELGPKLWARFLLWHFDCSDLQVLNAQLPLPIQPGERFVFGRVPKPTYRRTAPKLLQQAYHLGRNPDGAYTPEIHDNSSRFNLYKRIADRVRESRHWLLKDLAPFLGVDCPHIDTSVEIVNRLLAEYGCVLVREQCLQAWADVDPDGLERAEVASVEALTHSTQPEFLALLYALLHLASWHQREPYTIRLLAGACWDATQTFARSFKARRFDQAWLLGLQLSARLDSAISRIKERGHRSWPVCADCALPNVPSRFVLLPKTADSDAAMDCLHGGGDYFWELPNSFSDGCLKFSPTWEELRDAANTLEKAAVDFNRVQLARSVVSRQ